MDAILNILVTGVVVGVTGIGAAVYILKNLIYVCGPNEVLIFSGSKTQTADGSRGYRVIRGGRGMRWPLLESVHSLNLTNMIIEVAVTNAYAKGGIPLTVSGVANIKIASQSPNLDNAIERFTGKSRKEIIRISKETLEGNLRGVLSQLTPEEVNEDKTRFAEILLDEADTDLARLGLVLDTLKVQNVTDDRGFLDSIGRIRSAEVIKSATVSEAEAHARATIKDAANLQRARLAEIQNRAKEIQAEAERKIKDAHTKSDALVAEERGIIQAQIARANADIFVQNARVIQVQQQLEANLIEPSKADMASSIALAKGEAAPILEDGKATVAVLNEMIGTWKAGGESARDIFLMQKLQSVMSALVSSIETIEVDKVAVLPRSSSGDSGSTAANLARLNEEIRASVGVDVPQLIEIWKNSKES
jgi:flotillin